MGRIWQWSVSLIYIILIVNNDPVYCQGVANSCGCQTQYINNQVGNNGIVFSQQPSLNEPSYGSSINQAASGAQINQALIQGGLPYQQNSQSVQATATAVNTNSILSSPNLPCSSPALVPRTSTCAPSISQRLAPQCLGSPSIQLPNPGLTPLPSGCVQNRPAYQNIPSNPCCICNNQPNLYSPASTTVSSQASVNEVITSGYPSDTSVTQSNAIATSSVQSNNIQPSSYIPQQIGNQYSVRPPCGCIDPSVRQPCLYSNPIGNCQCQQGLQIYPTNQQYNTVSEQSVATATAASVGQQNVASSQSAAISQSTASNQALVPSVQQTSAVASAASTTEQEFAQQVVASTASAQTAVSSTSNGISTSSAQQATAVTSAESTTSTVASSQSTTSTSSTQSVPSSICQQPAFIPNLTSGNAINVPTKLILTSPCKKPAPSPFLPYNIYPPIQPIILQDSDNDSGLETWLPLLLVALLNDNCGNGGYCRC